MLLIICALLTSIQSFSQMNYPHLYLLPGQGGDQRLFEQLDLSDFEYTIINYSDTIPKKGESLPEYAKRIAVAIDTTRPFALVGVSFGGMLSVEISEQLSPEKVILISSAKNRTELAGKFELMRKVPFYKIIPGRMTIAMSHIGRPLFEPASCQNQSVFKNMIRAKSPKYMYRSVDMIVNWERTQNTYPIYHIHGTKDHTIPLKKVKNPEVLEGASHFAVYFRADEIMRFLKGVMRDE